ncbi:MAG: hypothetical protein J0M08_10220 [Bacteroidetes bacterium]|nr:hypothetical protein [Bacteroidota bacterium]
MRGHFLLFIVFVVFILVINSCAKEKADVSYAWGNEAFYLLLKDTAGHAFYKNNPAILAKASASPHDAFRVRFNKKAQSVLGSDGKLPDNGVFPDSSLIVKEIYTATSGGNLKQYAGMYKLNGSWQWGEYDPEGKTDYSVFLEGKDCTSCHSGNKDLVMTFFFH